MALCKMAMVPEPLPSLLLKMSQDAAPLVLVNGSDRIRAGFSGDSAPRAVFPSVVGYPKLKSSGQKDHYVGDEAMAKRGRLRMSYPIDDCLVKNWDDMEKIWHHTFYNELRTAPEDHAVLVTERPRNPKANRERTTEIMFETFFVPAFYLSADANLSLYASGRTTGVVLDCGFQSSRANAFYEGYLIPHATSLPAIGGLGLTMLMKKLLTESGYSFTTSADSRIVSDIKEKLGYVALDYEAELRKSQNSSDCDGKYELPDGQVMKVGVQRFRCAEALFDPSLAGGKGHRLSRGIHKAVHQTITKCDVDVRTKMYSNIILSGGSSLFPGIKERLTKELSSLVSPKVKKKTKTKRASTTAVEVVATPERKFSTWIGGSILTSLSTFGCMWVTKKEYENSGPGIIHRKCF